MTNEEIYQAWAPEDGPWSAWTKPVLFSSVTAEVTAGQELSLPFPVAPQTASVGVSTSKFVRKEGDVIRHNMGWTFILLAYLIVIAVGFYLVHPAAMTLN